MTSPRFIILHVRSIFSRGMGWKPSPCSLKSYVCPCLVFPFYFKVGQTKATCQGVSSPSFKWLSKTRNFSCEVSTNKTRSLKRLGSLNRQGTSGIKMLRLSASLWEASRERHLGFSLRKPKAGGLPLPAAGGCTLWPRGRAGGWPWPGLGAHTGRSWRQSPARIVLPGSLSRFA